MAPSPEPDRQSANGPLVTFHGVRSAPQDGPQTRAFGGHSSCIAISAGGTLLILDAGSGMRTCGLSLLGKGPLEGHVFFSRPTVVRTIGIPFFAPAFSADNSFTLYSTGAAIRSELGRLMSDPVFPVSPDIFNATVTFRDLEPGTPVALASNITITTLVLGGSMPGTAYRFDGDGWSLAWVAGITDHDDPDAIHAFARGAGLLIAGGDREVIDALIPEVSATELVITDHPPGLGDDDLADREYALQRLAPNARLARQGETLRLN
ncbi:MAG: hypothetical protein OXU19_07695 [bacterium]|nr:hypothetical protein [bacterium]MDE0417216.1 hypothetical protein [bacterium]